MKWRGCAILVFFVALALCTHARGGEWDGVAFEQPGPAEMRCWFVLPTRLVPDDADLPSDRKPHEFALRAGRNEYECVQLVILRTERIENISVRFGDFAGAGGATIAGSIAHANKLGQVTGAIATRSSPLLATWDTIAPDISPAAITPAMYSPSVATAVPDVLLPDRAFDLGVGLTRIWLTVHVPKDARPGSYRGSVRLMKNDGQLLHEIPLPLRVWNYSLPDEPSLTVLADVRPTTKPAAWKDLRPYYDDLKAHRINATGEVLPPPMWRRDHPPPDVTEYETALKHVLDELGFVRFRFPGGGAVNQAALFEPNIVATDDDGIWISEPAPRPLGAALASFTDKPDATTEHAFEQTFDEPVYLWLQADAQNRNERKILFIDGKVAGTIAADQFLAHPLRLASLPQPIVLPVGRHVLRIESEDTRGERSKPAPVEAVFLSPQQQPDFEKLMRERVVLAPASRDLFAFHADQMSDWLRAHGWLKKAHIKLDESAAPTEFARIALLHDHLGEVLPTVRRELATEPTPPLRKLVEVWTPDLLAATNPSSQEWDRAIAPGQELWATHPNIHTIGTPPIAMRLIPWALARHGLHGYVLGPINGDANALIYADPKAGGPVDSVRFELLREGLEDFEMLRMLRQSIDAAIGRNERNHTVLQAIEHGEKLFGATIPALVRSGADFSWDATAVQSARDEAGELLSLLATP